MAKLEPGILSAQGRDRALGAGGIIAAAGAALLWARGQLPSLGDLRGQRYPYDRSKRPFLQPAIVNTTYTDIGSFPPGSVVNDELIYPGDPDYWLKPGEPGYGQPIVRVNVGFS